ncbi:restriction endonuclease [Chitinophagaceae bacterium MMS25-I14]
MKYRIWMVRAGQGSYLIDDFLEKGFVAIGWNEIGKLPGNITYDELKTLFKTTYPEDANGRVNQCVGQIWKFLKEFKPGDRVVSYDSAVRGYYLGEIISGYEFSEAYEYNHYRNVKWWGEPTGRDTLSPDAKNTLGAISTLFELPESVWQELEVNNPANIEAINQEELVEAGKALEEQNLKTLKEDISSRSREFIKDIVSGLSWQDTENLVAGLLRSMGYKARMTARGGGDLGSDIIASPDELFLEQPLIKVEVKKRSKDKIGAPDIRNFIGGMRGHHKGIFVTTSGFSKEAVYEAERANFPITLIDSDWLVDLLVANYESLDPEIKALVPLKKIYWPV